VNFFPCGSLSVWRRRHREASRGAEWTPGDTDGPDGGGSAWLGEIARWSIGTGLAAPEVLRLVSRTVLAYGGKRKPDDATLMLVEWSPEEPGPNDG
jgi:hypothetical protein